MPSIPPAPAGVRDLAPVQKTCEHHWGTERGETCIRCGGSRDIIRPGWHKAVVEVPVDAPEVDPFSPEVMRPRSVPQMGTLAGCRVGLHRMVPPNRFCRVCYCDPENLPDITAEQATCKHDWRDGTCTRCAVTLLVARPGHPDNFAQSPDL